jgi:hypothetical protein
MAKDRGKETADQFHERSLEPEPRRRVGLLAIVAILTIVGIAVWLMTNNDEGA